MNWILNGINIVGCFYVVMGTIQIVYHDTFIRYGKGVIEQVIQSNNSELAAPGGPLYVVSFINPKSGTKISDHWIGLRVGPKTKVGDKVEIQYQKNKPNHFDKSQREHTEANARKLILIGIVSLAISITIRIWMVGRLI